MRVMLQNVGIDLENSEMHSLIATRLPRGFAGWYSTFFKYKIGNTEKI